MVRQKLYPNYWDNYYYEEGNSFINLVRTRAGKVIYRTPIPFDSPEEAKQYFENNCGA